MARETKVGLLAGLAFIVCFAVILANRGREAQTPLHRPYIVDAGQAAQQGQTRAARRQTAPGQSPASNTKVPNSGNSARQSPTLSPTVSGYAGSNVGGQQTASSPATGGQAPVKAAIRGSRSAQETRRIVDAQRAYAAANSSTPRAGGQVLPPVRTDGTNRPGRSALEVKLATLEMMKADGAYVAGSKRRNDLPSAASGQPGAAKPALGPMQQRRVKATYEVKPGDSLSRIAKQQYGHATTRVINAIFDANRATLSSPDVLKVGMKLALPEIADHPIQVAQTSQAVPQRKRTTDPSGDRPNRVSLNKRWRWYQIKKNDRYISIAREQLGDGARWREIFELNKDKFSDPSRIREGVKIKLPVTTVADGRKRTH